MKKLIMLAAACCMFALNACVNFKTEATVDVKVIKAGQPVSDVTVYKFKDNGLGEGTTLYKSNNSGTAKTDGAGVAHFNLKSPDDLDPSNVAGVELSDASTFFFCTYNAENTRNSLVSVKVKTGDKQKVQLIIDDQPRGGEED